MNKAIILRTIIITLFLLLIIIALTVTYFFCIDIETKEPTQIGEECQIDTYQFMDRKVFTIKNKNNTENIKYILYFHGGSYVAEATQNHWDFLEKVVKDTGYTVIMPDYPLTPKYNYKDVYNMIDPLYKEIIEKVGKDNLIMMGDSAGGGLALGVYEKMVNENVNLPQKVILISPWLDVRLGNEKIKEVEKKDTILNKEALKLAGIAYANEEAMGDYLVSPVEGELSKLKNIKIFIGTNDILNPDCQLLKEKADELGGDVKINEYEDAKHIWLIDNNSGKEITEKAYYDLIEELKNN